MSFTPKEVIGVLSLEVRRLVVTLPKKKVSSMIYLKESFSLAVERKTPQRKFFSGYDEKNYLLGSYTRMSDVSHLCLTLHFNVCHLHLTEKFKTHNFTEN